MEAVIQRPAHHSIPIHIKENILVLARRLPQAARSQFVRGCVNGIGDMATDYSRTLIFGAAGYILGEVIDTMLTFNIPLSEATVCLTTDRASGIGGVAGVLYGFFEDRQRLEERRRVVKIIAEELRKAHSGGGK